MLRTVLLVLLILLPGAISGWPRSRSRGSYRAGGTGLVLVGLVIPVLPGKVYFG